MLYVFNGFVNANKLMISGNEFYYFAQWIIKQNEILKQIQKSFLLTNPNNDSIQGNNAFILLCDTFPFVEVLIFACYAANAAFNAVAQQYKSIVIKKIWNYVFVVGEIIIVGVF